MGVSLVDMRVWEWLYSRPDATPAQLKEAVITAAKRYGIPIMPTWEER